MQEKQPPNPSVVEPLEQLEALLVYMLSADSGAIAPASRHSALSLAHGLVCKALAASKAS